ncbi:MAG TPA: hypothetical protein VEZ11_15365 [Thermoanaerobaculia bacterium]|nr:hypothetical protein [Thermoanaerobaculia bacterium]
MRTLVALAILPLPLIAQDFRSQEKITVERIIIDARVTQANGEPVLNLTPADFLVKIDGVPATIESLEWIPETAVGREVAGIDRPQPEASASLDVPAPRGRLLVFFFQTDFGREKVRIGGQMKVLSYADQLIESLDPDDRVAVLSYDSHLKFRLDFSDNKSRISEAIRSALLTDEPNRPQAVPMPSLASHLKPDELRATSTVEKGFIVLANALRPIPGPKSLILFGWGLGRYGATGVRMTHEYPAAKRALESARVSVFSMDFTEADAHTLAVGLSKVADDTGGFYETTFRFPQLAIDRLQKTLTGHYELEVRKPPTKVSGVHLIDVEIPKNRNLMVMARSSYVDRE